MSNKQHSDEPSSTHKPTPHGLLEADLAELRGTAATKLAKHIRESQHSQEIARSILGGYDALGSALKRNVEIDVRRIVSEGRSESRNWLPDLSSWFPPGLAGKWAMVSILVATITLSLFFGGRHQFTAPVEDAIQTTSSIAEAEPSTISRSNFAVVQTDNPDVKIYWFF